MAEETKATEVRADEPRTFTQEEVDSIVEGRLATERKRMNAEYKPL